MGLPSYGHFNPRAPCGARRRIASPSPPRRYFNPRAPCGARPTGHRDTPPSRRISIHAPRAGRDLAPHHEADSPGYFNPRAPCGARQFRWENTVCCFAYFNPRAPCGARLCISKPRYTPGCISIHAPRAGRDPALLIMAAPVAEFQSTRPVRGATLGSMPSRLAVLYFNPRAPCGARPTKTASDPSPHAFQSTRPVRGATPDRRLVWI